MFKAAPIKIALSDIHTLPPPPKHSYNIFQFYSIIQPTCHTSYHAVKTSVVEPKTRKISIMSTISHLTEKLSLLHCQYPVDRAAIYKQTLTSLNKVIIH